MARGRGLEPPGHPSGSATVRAAAALALAGPVGLSVLELDLHGRSLLPPGGCDIGERP